MLVCLFTLGSFIISNIFRLFLDIETKYIIVIDLKIVIRTKNYAFWIFTFSLNILKIDNFLN